jgi:hypothetical protein
LVGVVDLEPAPVAEALAAAVEAMVLAEQAVVVVVARDEDPGAAQGAVVEVESVSVAPVADVAAE